MPRYVSYDEAKTKVLKRSARRKLKKVEDSFEPPHSPAYVRQFFQSIKAEQYVSSPQWEFVFSCLMRSAQVGEALCGELFQKFGKYLPVDSNPPHIPESFRKRPVGPVRSDLQNLVFGRVQPFSKMASWYAAYFNQPEAVAQFNLSQELKALANKPPLAIAVDFPLGNYLMWSTFDANGRSNDPFQPRIGTVADFLAESGIKNRDEDYLKGETFIFTAYRLPTGLTPHFPTIFEAYAGQPNYYFRPIELRGSHLPYTMPLPTHADRVGRAEIVHGVVFAVNLISVPETKYLADAL